MRAPISRKTSLVRPSSAYYGKNFSLKQCDSDKEPGYVSEILFRCYFFSQCFETFIESFVIVSGLAKKGTSLEWH